MNILISLPKEMRIQPLPDDKVTDAKQCCISFPNSGIIPSGGISVSVETHRLSFHMPEQLEIITRRKLPQIKQLFIKFR
jgi:hypothetical protein